MSDARIATLDCPIFIDFLGTQVRIGDLEVPLYWDIEKKGFDSQKTIDHIVSWTTKVGGVQDE